MARLIPYLIAVCVSAAAARGDEVAGKSEFAEVFAEIHKTVAEHFFDPQLNGIDWEALGKTFGAQARNAPDVEAFATIVNQMLANLQTSHTFFYTSRDPGYYQLRSVFEERKLAYPGIGIFTKVLEGGTFVSGIMEGTPAHDAGLQVGDRIISVNDKPFHPIGSFEDHVGRAVSIALQRTEDADSVVRISVAPELLEPRVMFENAIRASVRIIERGPKRIGYIRMWSFAGDRYRNALQEEISRAPLREADALIIDLRDGWGGANPEDINIFNARVTALTFVARDGTERSLDSQWRKPVALLVNEGTRSGKEMIAYAFRKHSIGPVIGTRTAGAVVGGRPFQIRPGMLLYLAVSDVRVDGERLEGVGVEPDIKVEFSLPYAQGADPQLEAAVEALIR